MSDLLRRATPPRLNELERGFLFALLVPAIAGMSGCDRCAGVALCGAESPHAAVEGRLLMPESGHGVSGATISLIASAGSSRDSVITTTDATGLFSLVMALNGGPASRFSLRVSPPGLPGYLIDSVPCAPVQRRGDSCVLDPIVEMPTFPTFVFRYRNDPNRIVGNVHVTFARTGGTTLFGPAATNTYDVVTDTGYGVGVLFPPGVWAASLDPLVVDMTMELPSPIGTMIRHGYQIQPNYRFIHSVLEQLLGPGLGYRVVFIDSATQQPRGGIQLDFQRTGGIQSEPEGSTTFSDINGIAALNVHPLANGIIQGTVVLKAPGSAPATTLTGVAFATFDADSGIVFSRWKVGATGALYPLPPQNP